MTCACAYVTSNLVLDLIKWDALRVISNRPCSVVVLLELQEERGVLPKKKIKRNVGHGDC